MTRVLSTESAPSEEAAAYWRDVICDTYVQLDCEPAGDLRAAKFFGEVRQNKVSAIDVCTINASPQRVIRTKSLVSRSNEEVFIVPIQAKGRSYAIQDGRSAVLEAGDFAIVDSSRPYELQYPDWLNLLTLKVPRRTLMALSPSASSLTATRVNGRQGAGLKQPHSGRSLLLHVEPRPTSALRTSCPPRRPVQQAGRPFS